MRGVVLCFLNKQAWKRKEGRNEGMPAGQRRRIEWGGKCKGISFFEDPTMTIKTTRIVCLWARLCGRS